MDSGNSDLKGWEADKLSTKNKDEKLIPKQFIVLIIIPEQRG